MPVDAHTDSILDGGSIPPGSTVKNPNKENAMKYGLGFLTGIIGTFVVVGKFGNQIADSLNKLSDKIEKKK